MDDVGKVAAAKAGVQSQPRSLLLGNPPRTCAALPLGFIKSKSNSSKVSALAHRPDGIDERESAPVEPLLTQIEGVSDPRQASTHGPVANQKHGIGIDIIRALVDGQRCNFRPNTVTFAQENLRENRDGTRPFIQSDTPNFLPWHAAEQSNAQDRAARGNGD